MHIPVEMDKTNRTAELTSCNQFQPVLAGEWHYLVKQCVQVLSETGP